MSKRKTIMRTFKIHEISSVDSPAQKPAKAVLLKRDVDPLAKVAAMTTPMGNPQHTHLLQTSMNVEGKDVPMKSGQTSYVDGHFHPWIRGEDGIVSIGEAAGHAHEISIVSKTTPEETMTDAEKIALEKAQNDASAATKRAERAEKILKLTPDQRAHFEKLGDMDQDGFLAKGEDLRKSEVATALAKANEADPVVFTSASGEQFRKSDDPRLIAMAKRNDADRADLVKLSTERANEVLEKRAEAELGNLPGDKATKTELLKALDAVAPAHKEKVAELIRAANTGLAKAFDRVGTTGGGAPAAGSAEAQIEALAKTEAAKSNLPYAKAYAKVLATPEGSALYAKHSEEKSAEMGR